MLFELVVVRIEFTVPIEYGILALNSAPVLTRIPFALAPVLVLLVVVVCHPIICSDNGPGITAGEWMDGSMAR